jgi:hypothetical protein
MMQKAPPEMGSSSDKQPDTRSLAIPPPGQTAPASLCSNGFRMGPGKIGAADAVTSNASWRIQSYLFAGRLQPRRNQRR